MDRANLSQLQALRPEARGAHVGLFLEYASLDDHEVPDPYYGGVEDFERVLDLCEQGARGLLAKLSH